MKLTQWFEGNLFRAFLELNHSEIETMIKFLQGQLNNDEPMTLTHKLNTTVTDTSGKPKQTAKGIITVAAMARKNFPIDTEAVL